MRVKNNNLNRYFFIIYYFKNKLFQLPNLTNQLYNSCDDSPAASDFVNNTWMMYEYHSERRRTTCQHRAILQFIAYFGGACYSACIRCTDDRESKTENIIDQLIESLSLLPNNKQLLCEVSHYLTQHVWHTVQPL